MNNSFDFTPVSITEARKTLDTGGFNVLPVQDKSAWIRRPAGAADVTLLTYTKIWLDKLPVSIRPAICAIRYPRVVNQIYARWSNPNELLTYMGELLLDSRGTRKGFPYEVAAELSRLRDFYRQQTPSA